MTTKNIVIVEDDAKDEMLMLRAFRKINLANPLIVLRDGEEALEYFQGRVRYADRDLNDIPAVVLLDLNMPKIGGLELLRILREDPRYIRLPVVILTSSDEQSDRLKSYELGANSFVRKPIEFNEFSQAVANLGVYWTMLNVPPE